MKWNTQMVNNKEGGILAWHFTGATLRDGRPIPAIGETLRHDGLLESCRSGLHASERLTDALMYAPGALLHRVKMSGYMRRQGDKIVAAERTILWSIESTAVLRAFARKCALDVLHLWDAPAAVRVYLATGNEALQIAAWSAAEIAPWGAARSAARAAAQSSAWLAARDAAEIATEIAAEIVEWSAAWADFNDVLTTLILAAAGKRQ